MSSHAADQLTAMRRFLDEKILQYNTPAFILKDPVSIPHRFIQKQDIEIAGLFAAVLAWGNRTSIINNCDRLLTWMDSAPYQFIHDHQDNDLKRFLAFAHRTFNATDLLYFFQFLQEHYRTHSSLEDAFVPGDGYDAPTIQQALIHFHHYFFSLPEFPERTRKHISTPVRNSACKRLCMYLRWMVRKDKAGVDFGLWHKIVPMQLVCPLDVHVARVAHRFGLINTEKASWNTALELTATLRQWRPDDPTVYDYALFGLGAEERI
jgi:uncharacterized protein (TIGR02757 family)